jgi:hypothetical protein
MVGYNVLAYPPYLVLGCCCCRDPQRAKRPQQYSGKIERDREEQRAQYSATLKFRSESAPLLDQLKDDKADTVEDIVEQRSATPTVRKRATFSID